jgi:hypothetical protein
MKPPESPTPTADTIGMSPWAYNLMLAGLGVLGLNGLACCLTAYAFHHPRHHTEKPRMLDRLIARLKRRERDDTTEPPAREMIAPAPPPKPHLVASRGTTPAGSVDEWVMDRLEPVKGAKVPFREAYLDYQAWCRRRSVPALEPDQFGGRLAKLCEGTDVHARTGKDGTVYLVGVRLAATADLVTA